MDASLAQVPPEAQGKDPADSLYRMARQALNRNDYQRSAELFQSIRGTYPKSAYVPDANTAPAFTKGSALDPLKLPTGPSMPEFTAGDSPGKIAPPPQRLPSNW